MKYKDSITENDLFGRFHIGIQDPERYNSYYFTIHKLIPLLKSEDFNCLLIGYYINAINFVMVRLSYFICDGKENQFKEFVKDFLIKTDLFEVSPEEKPHLSKICEGYGGEKHEFQFRIFLNLISRIAIELLTSNPEHAKSLAMTYRWQVFPLNGSVESHFESSFQKYSKTYRSLSQSQLIQLWEDIALWPGETNFDWAHFLINPILAFDWRNLRKIKDGARKTISEINNEIPPDYDFKVSEDWLPNV